MKIIYKKAPLPFLGQKTHFLNEVRDILMFNIPNYGKDYIIVDLFGGSGLLSRLAKDTLYNATVIYNDFDDYHLRIENYKKITHPIQKELSDKFYNIKKDSYFNLQEKKNK